VHLVVLDETTPGNWSPASAKLFIPDPQHDLATRLLELSKWLTHQVSDAKPRAALVTDLDQKGGYGDTMLLSRHTADGIALAALRVETDRVAMRSHKWIGERLGLDKRRAQAEASTSCGASYKEAGAAARAATTL
jgi:hypothetical protein